MKRLLALVLLALVSAVCAHTQTLPNVSYNALLSSTCSTPSTFCSGTANPLGTGVSGLTGSALDVNSQNYAVATVTVAGTYSAATVNFEFSDQTASTNYFSVLCSRTDANIVEGSEANLTNTVRAWQCPVIATTRFRIRVSAISSGSINTWITLTQTAIDPSPTVVDVISNIPGTTDPCQNSSLTKSSALINIASATTTQLVALSGSTKVYVCGFALSYSVAGSIQWEYGTGASCGTGTTTLTGAILATANEYLSYPGGSTAFATAAGNALCLVTTGTTPSAQGWVTYIQQ